MMSDRERKERCTVGPITVGTR